MKIPNLNISIQQLQQIAGAVIAIITLVIGLATGLSNSSSQNPSQPWNPSAPSQTARTVYLADLPTSAEGRVLHDNYTTTVGSQTYPKSMTAQYTNGATVYARYENIGRWNSLDAKVAYDSTVKVHGLSGDSKQRGRLQVFVDDNMVEEIYLWPGEVKNLHVNLSNMRSRLEIRYEGKYSDWGSYGSKVTEGLSLLTPTLSR